MGGFRGGSSWMCGSERARTAKIEVPCPPHSDHLERSFKGSRPYAHEVSIIDARDQEHSINYGAMEHEDEGDSIEARKPGVFPPPPVEEWRSIIMCQMVVQFEHQLSRGASSLH